MFAVRLTDEAKAQVKRLPMPIKLRLGKILDRLADWPNVSGVKPLRHELAGSFRIRPGDYRIVFFVKGEVVMVTGVDNRRDVYED